jgi:hypothetical protein
MPGYSGTPLAKKLGIKPNSSVHLIGAPPSYRALVSPLPDGVAFQARVDDKTDLVHAFATKKLELARLLKDVRKRMRSDVAIWVSWPKRAAKVETDITEDTIRDVALPMGLVDVKVCAVDEVWSGLKLVIRKEHR